MTRSAHQAVAFCICLAAVGGAPGCGANRGADPGPGDSDSDPSSAGGSNGRGGSGGGGTKADTGAPSGNGGGGGGGQGGTAGSSGVDGSAGAGGGQPDAASKDTAAATPDASAPSDRFPDPEIELTSSKLPVLMIDVKGKTIVQATKIAGTLKVIEDHDDTLSNLATSPVTLTSPISIAIHGATSAGLDKKSFGIELQDGTGMDMKMPLVGLPSGSDWVLHACGQDPTCMRNALSYAIGRDMGRYNPRTRISELYIDGKYQGIYVVVEKIRQDKNRVNIPKPAATAAEGDITGGYIYKMDLGQGMPSDKIPQDWVSTTPMHQMVYSYYYPRFDQITPEQRTYLQGVMNGFEKMMNSTGWDDPVKGYTATVDLTSWVDFGLFQEMVNNIDAYQKSLYFQKLPQSMGNKIVLGPLWDYDYAYGVAGFRDGDKTNVWAFNMNKPDDNSEPVPYTPPTRVPHVPFYWENLWKKNAQFQNAAHCRWNALRGGPFAKANFDAKINAFLKQVALAQPRDTAKWKNLGTKTYAQHVDDLRTWIDARLKWIDANLPGKCP